MANADLSITINRTDLEPIMLGAATFDDQVAAGKAVLDGNKEILEQLKEMLTHFEVGFEIMPGTGGAVLSPERETFEQEPVGDTSGG